jgi:hypothetical protein
MPEALSEAGREPEIFLSRDAKLRRAKTRRDARTAAWTHAL